MAIVCCKSIYYENKNNTRETTFQNFYISSQHILSYAYTKYGRNIPVSCHDFAIIWHAEYHYDIMLPTLLRCCWVTTENRLQLKCPHRYSHIIAIRADGEVRCV